MNEQCHQPARTHCHGCPYYSQCGHLGTDYTKEADINPRERLELATVTYDDYPAEKELQF